jgi:hypothetical protein
MKNNVKLLEIRSDFYEENCSRTSVFFRPSIELMLVASRAGEICARVEVKCSKIFVNSLRISEGHL